MNLHGWTPVMERLPKNNNRVLVSDGVTWGAGRFYPLWEWDVSSGLRAILYWKPAPELPEVERKERA